MESAIFQAVKKIWLSRDQINPPTLVLVLLAALAFLFIIILQAWTFSSNPTSALVPEVSAKKGDVAANWAWNSGADKPRIQMGDETIVEISGWESDISVNGQEPVLLWHHYMGANAIGDSLYTTFSRPDEYLLEQQVVLGDNDTVIVQYFFTPLGPVDDLELRLGHFKWWWNDTEAEGNVFEGTADDSWTRITFGSFFRRIEINQANDNDKVNFFDAYFKANDVKERTLIAAEAIEFGKP